MGSRKGVLAASVNLDRKRGRFKYDSKSITDEDVRLYVEEAGFDAFLQDPNKKESRQKCLIAVEGMTCQSCVKSIEGQVGDVKGVCNVKVSLEEETAFIDYDPNVANAELLRTTVEDCGFDAVIVAEAQVEVKGMTCQSCVRKIESGLKDEEGITWSKVSLEEKLARVRFDPSKIQAEKVAEKIGGMGFKTKLKTVDGLIGENDGEAKASTGAISKNKVSERLVSVTFDDDDDDKLERCFVSIRGMTCASCVASIEKHVKKMRGVESILVALMAAKAEVRYNPELVTPEKVSTMHTT